MNLANRITLARLAITTASFVLLECVEDPAAPSAVLVWWAFGLFVFAALTDIVDGWVARRFDQVTPFGRVADPFCDKLLICGVLILLLRFPAASELLATWMVVVVVSREFLVTAIRGMAETSGMNFPADRLGKLKMLVQSVTAAALLARVAGSEWCRDLAVWGVWLTVLITVISGLNYLWKARRVLRAA